MEIGVFSLKYFDKVNNFLRQAVIRLCGTYYRIVNDGSLKDSLTVFVYHDVSEHPSEFSQRYNLNVTPERFNYQIEFIKSKFNMISPDDLLSQHIPSKAALITFDDGFRSYFKNAIPILERHNVPSIIFLNMEPIEGGMFWAGLITYLIDNQEDFRNYLINLLQETTNEKPLFLCSSRKVVNSYLGKIGKSFEKEVSQFVGEFATKQDLDHAAVNPLVYYGNHLFNHDVPLLMSDEDLVSSYFQNANELKKYSNYRDMFAFPFGQPDTCYSDKQVKLLYQNGAKKIFSSSGLINSNVIDSYLHRASLNSFHDSHSKIWFQIFQRSLRNKLRLSNQNKYSC